MADDRWVSRDRPILEAVASHEEEGRVDTDLVREETGLTERELEVGTEALVSAGMLRGQHLEAGRFYMGFLELTGPGRRAVGQWPSEIAGVELLRALERAAATEPDPETKGRLERAADAMRPLGIEILTQVAVSFAKRVAGLPY